MQKCNLVYQKASALLSALFIMTLVAIAATAMSLRIQLDIYRTGLIVDTDKLYLASQGVVFWAMDTLSNPKNKLDVVNNQGVVASLPAALQKIYPNVALEGRLYDLQARLNLNTLDKKPTQEIFQNLLAQVLPNIEVKNRKALTQAIVDWISVYDPGKGKDQWLGAYLRLKPPYQTSHQPMTSISELRLIQGVNANEYLALAPFVTALPEIKTPLNIKTIPKALVMALSDKITEEQANQLIQDRNEPDYQEKARAILQSLKISTDDTGFQSNYFLVVAIANQGELQLVNYSILKRSKAQEEGQNESHKESKIEVSLISESLNAL